MKNMKVINRSFKTEDLTRAKKTAKPFIVPEKNMNEENVNMVFEGHYLRISRSSSKSQENPKMLWKT